MQEARHFGMDAEIQRPWMAIFGLLQAMSNTKDGY